MASLTKSEKVARVLYFITLFSFIAALIYVPVRAALDAVYREGTELHLIIFQTLFGLLVVNLPLILHRRFKWQIPGVFSAAYTVFLYASIFLGEVLVFYYRVPFWDDLLHLSSSMMLGLFGFSAVEMLNGNKERQGSNLSPFFVSVFSATFAISIGILWEIYEFTFDGILGLNMQKFAVENAENEELLINLVGRAALMDTMIDIIIDTVGAVAVSLVGYVSLKRGWKFINAFKVTLPKKAKNEQKKPKNRYSKDSQAPNKPDID